MGFSRFELENIALCKNFAAQSSGVDLQTQVISGDRYSAVSLTITIPPTCSFHYRFDEGVIDQVSGGTPQSPSGRGVTKEGPKAPPGIPLGAPLEGLSGPHLCLPVSNLGNQKGSWVYCGKTLRSAREGHGSGGMSGIGYSSRSGWFYDFHNIFRGNFVFSDVPCFLVTGAPLIQHHQAMDPQFTLSSPFCLGDLRILFDFGIEETSPMYEKLGYLTRQIRREQAVALYRERETVAISIAQGIIPRDSLEILREALEESRVSRLDETRSGLVWHIQGNIPYNRISATILGIKDRNLKVLIVKGPQKAPIQGSSEQAPHSGISVHEILQHCLREGWESALLTRTGSSCSAYLTSHSFQYPLCLPSGNKPQRVSDLLLVSLR